MLASSVMPIAAEESTGNYSSPRLYGYLRHDAETFTQAGGPRGLYSIDIVPDGRVTPVSLEVGGIGGACYGDGKYYVIDYTQNNQGELTSVTLKIYDPSNWTVTYETDIPQTSIPTTMTYNPADNQIYGCFFNNNSDKMEFGILDKEKGTTDVIKVLDTSIAALAADNTGAIYAIDTTGDLLKYNSTTQQFALVGPTGLTPQYIQDATFDFGTRMLYWFAMTANEEEAGVYSVDLTTGKASRLTSYVTGEKEFTGVFSMTPVFPSEVPSIVTNVTADVDPSRNVSLQFTMPGMTYGDTPLSEILTYEILVDGVSVKSGQAEAGKSATAQITVENGDRVVSIRATNAAGIGPEYIIRRFVGFDQPEKVENILAVRTAEGIRITWNPVETGVHALPVDIENIRYKVVRMPEGVEISSGIKTTECIDNSNPSESALVYYEVTATDGTNASTPWPSNQVVIGEATPLPFSYDFRDKPGMGLFTSIDNNADGASWMFRDKYGILCMYSATESADDWLITPPMKLSKGRKYKITSSIGVAMYPERFEIRYGKGAQVADMTYVAVEPKELDSDNAYYRDVWREPGNIVAEISPEEDGEYNLAVHAISDPNALFLYCCDFAVEDNGEASLETVINSSDTIAVYPGADNITISGASGDVEIYSVSGLLIAAETVKGIQELSIPVPPGFYIVKSGSYICKITVK